MTKNMKNRLFHETILRLQRGERRLTFTCGTSSIFSAQHLQNLDELDHFSHPNIRSNHLRKFPTRKTSRFDFVFFLRSWHDMSNIIKTHTRSHVTLKNKWHGFWYNWYNMIYTSCMHISITWLNSPASTLADFRMLSAPVFTRKKPIKNGWLFFEKPSCSLYSETISVGFNACSLWLALINSASAFETTKKWWQVWRVDKMIPPHRWKFLVEAAVSNNLHLRIMPDTSVKMGGGPFVNRKVWQLPKTNTWQMPRRTI